MQPRPETNGPPTPTPVSRPKRRISGFAWILISITALFVAGVLISTLRRQQAPPRRTFVEPPQIYFGVNEFINVDSGVSFDIVFPPGAPADKAGLVGGDIVTSFDGHPIKRS